MLHIIIITVLISSAAFAQNCTYKYFNNVTVNVTTVQDVTVSYTLTNCSISREVLPEYTYEIIVNDQNISDISPVGVSDLLYVKSITFNRNQLEVIRPNAFYNLPSLNYLNLDENRIKELWFAALSSTESLEQLSLRKNLIEKIDSTSFIRLKQLKVINLDDNKLSSWDNQWFERNNKLEEIHMKGNRITFIPRDAFKNNMKLNHIDFSHNALMHVNSGAFNGFRRLKTLNLSNNKLSTLKPDTFANFKPTDKKNTTKPSVGDDRLFVAIELTSFFQQKEQVSDGTNGIENLFLHANRLTYLPQLLLEDLINTKYVSTHSNPFQCACEKLVAKWTRTNDIKLNVNSKSCTRNSNPICVASVKSPNVCLEEHDEEVAAIYFKVYQSVENAPADDITCF